MLIAIATNENYLKAFVDMHFGRCDWYCLYDTETRKSAFVENPVRHHREKAGCDAAEFLIDKGVNMAVAGRFGSRVVDVFRKKNVQMVIPEAQHTIEEIINQIKS
jgi:predicted Fe-Mo cluster-binding NifX family protein